MSVTVPDPKATLGILCYSEAKVGKSWLAATAPKPMVLLDAEGGSRFLPVKKVVWDPMRQPPPKVDGTWDIAVVYVREYAVVAKVYQYLVSGKHPFKSVGIDSITEIQKKCLDKIVGGDSDRVPETQDWGALLRQLEELVRKMRDLTFHPTKPLDCVVITALSTTHAGKSWPMVKGQLADTLPGFPDVIGFLYAATVQVGEKKTLERRLRIQPTATALAGDRTHRLTEKLGSTVPKPHLGRMIEVLRTETDDKEES